MHNAEWNPDVHSWLIFVETKSEILLAMKILKIDILTKLTGLDNNYKVLLAETKPPSCFTYYIHIM